MGDPDPNTPDFSTHYLRHTRKGYTFKFMTEWIILLALYTFFAVYTFRYNSCYEDPVKEDEKDDMETPEDNDSMKD